MSLPHYSQKLYILPASLILWLIVAGIALIWADPKTFLLALALLAFTATLSLTNLFRFSNWFGAVLAIGVYTAVLISINGSIQAVWIPVALFSVATLLTALLGGWMADEIRSLYRQLTNDQKLIEELRLYEPETGVMRYRYVYQTLRSEVLRSQRYDKHICVLLVDIGSQESLREELGSDGLEHARRQVIEMMPASLRAMDIPFSGEKTGAILPETNLEGAQKVVERLLERVQRKLRIPLNIGLAEFPGDGVSEDELIHAAEAALRFSQTTGQPFVEYGRLRQTNQSQPAG